MIERVNEAWEVDPRGGKEATHPVRRRLEGSGRGPRKTRVSAASPSSRFTRHYTMSQGWQLVSLDSRLRLQLAREELALSLPPNPEDAPLLLTPQPLPPDRLLLFSRFFPPDRQDSRSRQNFRSSRSRIVFSIDSN